MIVRLEDLEDNFKFISLKKAKQIYKKNDLLCYSFTYGMNEYIIQALIVNRSNVNSSKIMNSVRSSLRKIGLN